MQINTGFRLSTYSTVLAACVCLAYAEQSFVAGIWYLVGPLLVLFVVAYLVEGRWALSVRAANALAVLIAIGASVWIGSQMVRLSLDQEAIVLLAESIPFLGPLLMTLLLVKAFRPKDARDHWLFHGMALLQVVLGCILASEPLFGLVLVVYLLSAVWSLSIFYQFRRGQAVEAETAVVAGPPLLPWRLGGLTHMLLCGLGVLLLGGFVYLLLPRKNQADWDPWTLLGRSRRVQVFEGSLAFAEIDLNYTGTVELDETVVMSVFASQDVHAQEPKVDLDPGQRWRGVLLDFYHRPKGSWFTVRSARVQGLFSAEEWDRLRSRLPLPPPADPGAQAPRDPAETLSHLGPEQFFVTFAHVPRVAGGVFLAEPAIVPYARPYSTVVALQHDLPFRMTELQRTLMPFYRSENQAVNYRQVTVPCPLDQLQPVELPTDAYLDWLCDQPIPEIDALTRNVLQGLVRAGSSRLDAADLPEETGTRRASQEKVAWALCEYLSNSGLFTYSLTLRRRDTRLDPTLDFLTNVREGHCERFASALALMLRSVRIPARVVKGYRGADSRGDGWYDIRNNHAHSWVEAAVWHEDEKGELVCGWLTLDPTPGGFVPTRPKLDWLRWLRETGRAGEAFWADFIVGYNSGRQAALVEDLGRLVANGSGTEGHAITLSLGLLAALLALPLSWWFVRRRRSRTARDQTAPSGNVLPCYARWLALLERYGGLRPTLAETPAEFGRTAQLWLDKQPGTAASRDVPGRLIASFYRARYGGETLSEPEEQEIASWLDQLAETLERPERPPVAAAPVQT